jgi:hypothetical protein
VPTRSPALTLCLACLTGAPLAPALHAAPAASQQPAQPAAPADGPHASDVRALLRDVRTIAAPGVPGPLVVFGARAFPVVVAPERKDTYAPVVAAAHVGAGRAVAFGHTGYLDAPSLDVGDTRTLIRNAVAWAGARAATPRVGVVRNGALADALRADGLNCRALDANWTDALGDLDVVCVVTHALTHPQREALRAFVNAGGGVLGAGLGWGWLQLNPDRTLREHPGNDLFSAAGLAWGDGTLDRTHAEGFAADTGDVHSPHLHALRVLDAIESGGGATPQGSHTLSAAVRVAPTDAPLFARVRTLLDGRTHDLAPSQGSPLRASRPLERVLLALQVELERRSAPHEIAAHPAAAAFPGFVPADAPRVDRTIEIDPSRPGWQSTGLYAAPGEVVRVVVPPGVSGLRVRIGCHTDHLWHHDAWRRVPDIARQFPLRPGETPVASAFGGLIYIEAPGRAGGGRVPVEVRNAVQAMRFVRGVTTPDEWRAQREQPNVWAAPWGEVESSKVIVSVPSDALRTLDDPEALMAFWDAISDAHATLGQVPLDPLRPHRFVPDVQISAGYMHSGYPIMTHLDAVPDMVSTERLRRGTWGLLHELGHNHQVSDWTFDGTVEVTCNLFSLHAIDTICTPPDGSRGHPGVDSPPSLARHLAAGAPFDAWKRDPFLALHMYVQLERAFGWETYKRVFAEYRDLPRDQRPRSEMDKRDQWMVRFSRACGHNLGPFFQAWGVPTSDAARASIADLPAWMPEDWPGEKQ